MTALARHGRPRPRPARAVLLFAARALARWSWWKPETQADKDAVTAAVRALEGAADTVTLTAEAAHRLYEMSSPETLHDLDWCAGEDDPRYPPNHPAVCAGFDLEAAVHDQAPAAWERLVDAETALARQEAGKKTAEPEAQHAWPPEPPPDHVGTADYSGGRGSLGGSGELAGRQYAALAQVKIWTWERYAPGRRGGPRQRERVRVEKNPDYWSANLGSDAQQICSSLALSPGHGLEPDEYRKFHGENHELHPVTWRVTWGHAQSATRLRNHWCDAHLPDEYRPGMPHETAPPMKPRKKQPEPSYYATWGHYDRTGQAKVHYWYRVRSGRHEGQIRPWPPGRTHFGQLYRAGIPDEKTCMETFDCTPRQRQDWYWADVKDVRAAAMREIGEHPEEAAARFAVLQSNCCCCGRALTDERSKAYGVGPDCREGMPPAQLKFISDLAAREHARALREAS